MLRRRFLVAAPAVLLPSAAFAAAGPLISAGRNKRANWHPQDLSASVLKGWWCADDHGTTKMTDDGSGLISAWVDRISGISATGTTTARPTWASNSFNTSFAGLTFDGTANCLVNTAFTALPTGAVAGEIWAVGSQTALTGDATQRYIIQVGGGGATSRTLIRAVGGGPANRFRVSDQTTALTDTVADLSTNFIGGGAWAGTTESGRINGADMSPSSTTIATIATATSRLRIGASANASATLFWQGIVRHVIVTMTLTAARRLQLEGWLAWDSGLTGLLPASHPYKSVRP